MARVHPEEVAAALVAELGPEAVVTAPEALAAYALDTWPLRLLQAVAGRRAQPPLAAVRPRTTEEVARALRCLHRLGVPVVPYGAGSGVAGGAEPPPGAVVLDTRGLDRILGLDEVNLTVTVQAGVVLGRLEAWLNQRGYVGGHYPQSIDRATVGGLVATRSSGQFSTRYGNVEDLVVGLEAVLPDGEVVRLRALPRRAVGPDLRHLWIGSEGTLGVVTEVTLKVFPRPPERWLQAYAFPSMRSGLEAIRGFMRQGWRPAVVRLHDAVEAQRGFAPFVPPGRCILLVLSEGPEGYPRLEGEAVDRITREAGGQPLGPEPVEAWLEHRNDVSAFERYIGQGILVDTVDVAAPWSTVADLYEEMTSRLPREVPELLVISGHSSHSYPQGTNLYFILGAAPPRDPEAVARVYWAIWSRAMAITLARGGTICHHHGIGRLRAAWVPREPEGGYGLLARVKRALDPAGIMNPGALLPLAGPDGAGPAAAPQPDPD